MWRGQRPLHWLSLELGLGFEARLTWAWVSVSLQLVVSVWKRTRGSWRVSFPPIGGLEPNRWFGGSGSVPIHGFKSPNNQSKPPIGGTLIQSPLN